MNNEEVLQAALEVVRAYRVWQDSMRGIRCSLPNPDEVVDRVERSEGERSSFFQAVRDLATLVSEGEVRSASPG